MPLTQRINSLKKRHTDIEAKLQTEENRPAKDEAKVSKLKREKLTLKDEITRLNVEQETQAA